MAAGEQDRHQIAAVLEQYRRGFATLDVEGLAAIWDQDYDHILYIPQEAAQPVRGWAMTVSDVSVHVLGDVAYAFCSFHFEGEMKGQRQPHIADGRNTFILRRTSRTWKVIHYHESRPGDILLTEEGESE